MVPVKFHQIKSAEIEPPEIKSAEEPPIKSADNVLPYVTSSMNL